MSTSSVLNHCTGPFDCCSQTLEQINTIQINELPIMADFLSIKNSFRKSNILCDVTLIAGDGVKIFAHKVVLASVSTFFLKMFTAAFKEKDNDIVYIQQIDSEILEDILMAANFLDVESVIVKCCYFIEEKINFKNSFKFFELGKLLQESCKKLYYVTFSFILEHFFEMERSILLEMALEDIMKFISNDGLVIQTEEQIFNFVLDWVKFNEKNRKDFFCELMKHVRLPLISKTFLVEIVSNTPLVTICFECSKLLIEALKINLSSSPANFAELSVRTKKRIPLYLKNTPNMKIIALQNCSEEKYVDFLDTSIPNPIWETGSLDLIPPNKYSKIVSLKKNFLFSIGGFDKAGILTNDVFSLDLSYNWKFWVRRKPLIFCRQHFAVCTNENHIYVIGGIDGSNHMVYEIEYFCMNSKQWHLLSTMETPRRNCNAIYHNNIIYVIGGKHTDNIEYISTVDCFSVSLNKWINGLKPLPNIMKNIKSILINNTIYVIGNNFNTIKITLFSFDLQIDVEWLQLSSFNSNLGNEDIAEVNGKIYVICENNLNNRHYHRSLTKKSVKVYDINKRNWSTLDTSLKVSCENILVVVMK